MATDFSMPVEKWLTEVRELASKKEIFLLFEFHGGRIVAKLSRLQVDDTGTILLQRESTPLGLDAIDLLLSLPPEPLAQCEKRVNESGGIRLSVSLGVQIEQIVHCVERLHLSNQEAFLTVADSESRVQ